MKLEIEGTDEMIADSSKFYLVSKLIMSEHLATDSIQPRIEDFCVFDSISVNFYPCNA
jgi:hypothetical protein